MYKKLLLMIAITAVMVLAACGGGNNDNADNNNVTPPSNGNTQQPPANNNAPVIGDTNADNTEYLATMHYFFEIFEEELTVMGALLGLADTVQTYADVNEWRYEFHKVVAVIDILADGLGEALLRVSEEFMDAHIMVSMAVEMVFEAMLELDIAVSATLAGDYNAFDAGVDAFMDALELADMIWAEAMPYFG